MRQKLPLLAVLVVAAVMAGGCANTERKFGRGLSNTCEIARLGEFRRTMEQSALFDGPDYAYSTGVFRGLTRTFARTGAGLYQMITSPIPNYEPTFSDYLAANPPYPDNYQPALLEDAMFATDANLGFSGGDVAPMVPGSRFRIFDTH